MIQSINQSKCTLVQNGGGTLFAHFEFALILLVHGDLPRQHSFGTALRFTGPVLADSRQ